MKEDRIKMSKRKLIKSMKSTSRIKSELKMISKLFPKLLKIS
jgi:hypothetical protein